MENVYLNTPTTLTSMHEMSSFWLLIHLLLVASCMKMSLVHIGVMETLLIKNILCNCSKRSSVGDGFCVSDSLCVHARIQPVMSEREKCDFP